ncbi:hypothetical protein BBH88_17150 [Planococcus antarcticus DSM 14505]|uniref:Uncharacterized protein n=1 Tax=Planococcus antarcticus DSM 14505 TaxID=1185653 RepID=A0ABN4RN31_9BACL|nr:hypothetical protein [Planococcus antarcticus]ANU11852.1 hypothetical protein BBH88_17150 [Planococcus antarcticus DSM 14505]
MLIFRYNFKYSQEAFFNIYTYSSFESFGTFTLLRPILFLLLAVALLLFIALLIPKIRMNLLNRIAVISLSVESVVVGIQVVYYHAIIVDEIGLGGDTVSLFLFLAIALFGLLNPLLYLLASRRNIFSKT